MHVLYYYTCTLYFLIIQVDDTLAEYKSKYDIVICEDETMNLVNCLLQNIIVSSQ